MSLLVAGLVAAVTSATVIEPPVETIPGIVIHHVPAATKTFVGSPSLAIMPDGTYVASHDLFGPGSSEWTSAVTEVFRSRDRGATWSPVARVQPAFWSGLFVHGGSLYLMGTTHHHGRIVIRRSDDGGATWTTPDSETTGLLTEDGAYHTAPMPVLVHGGRVWRAFEDAGGGTEWGKRYRAMMLSAADDADLLDRRNWTFSNTLARDPNWLKGRFNGWLEGNAVVGGDGRVFDMLRVDAPGTEQAALVEVSADGRRVEFDPERGFVEFPGGAKKFAVRRDPRSKTKDEPPVWWTLASVVAPVDAGRMPPGAIRNTLALMRSDDLRHWEMRSIVLHHPDVTRHGFQYVDWLFDGDDLVAVSRTAHDDAKGGAPRAHDANYLTFHRFADFRDRVLADSVVDPATLGWPAAGSTKGAAAATAAPRSPNVVVIVADDLGWRDLGCTGSPWHSTPRIDGLRAAGMLFTEAHAAAPICSASRAALLTGLAPARLHYEFVPKWQPGRQVGDHVLRTPDYPLEMPAATPTVATALAAAGYHTAFVGKWHLNRHHGRYLGWLPGHGPESFGFASTADDAVPGGIVPRAVRMLAEAPGDRPFLLWVSHTLVHDPFTKGSEPRVAHHRARFAAEGVVRGLDERAHFAAMVESLDDDVGRLLDALERHGMADHTIVVFTSDNGGHPAVSTRAPLRGSKWNLYQGGVRVPLIIRWPGAAAEGTASAVPVIGTDLAATILEACGVESLPRTDGRSLVPLLAGDPARPWDERPLVWHYPFYSPETNFTAALPTIGVDDGGLQQVRPHAAIRVGSSKLIHWFEDGSRELYDLVTDPSEAEDRAADQPAQAAVLEDRLLATLRDWEARLPAIRVPGDAPLWSTPNAADTPAATSP
ncbi:MAG: sulfatase-like hydrolase/transferase [Planctomycetaceae bacterium]